MAIMIDQDKFYTQLDDFEMSFRKQLLEILPLDEDDSVDEAWKATRDTVLPNYPLLDYLYRQHGLYNKLPYDEQPEAARLGRKVAGLMSTVLRSCQPYVETGQDNGKPIDTNVSEKARYVGIAKRGKRSDIQRTQAKRHRTRKADRSSGLAEALRDIAPGEYIKLAYESYEPLRLDQSLIKLAVQRLGWFRGIPRNTTPYESWSVEDGEYIYLIITRLEEPRPSKRYQ